MKEAEERADTSSALLFGQLDFRVTKVMILIAAARSRIANIEPRYSDILTELEKGYRLLYRIDLKMRTKKRKRGKEREISRNEKEL